MPHEEESVLSNCWQKAASLQGPAERKWPPELVQICWLMMSRLLHASLGQSLCAQTVQSPKLPGGGWSVLVGSVTSSSGTWRPRTECSPPLALVHHSGSLADSWVRILFTLFCLNLCSPETREQKALLCIDSPKLLFQ